MLTASPRQLIDGLPRTSNGGEIEALQLSKIDKAEHSDKKKTEPEKLQPLRGANVGDIPLGGILDMVKSGYYCWIGLGGP